MATACVGRVSKKLTPEQIAAHKRAAAVAELQRNGIKPPPDSIFEALAGAQYEIPMAPLPPDRQYRSRPDAVEIPKAEVTNFEPLTKWDLAQINEAVEDAQWGGWPEGDQRWTLTPSEWRKQKRRALTLQKERKAK